MSTEVIDRPNTFTKDEDLQDPDKGLDIRHLWGDEKQINDKLYVLRSMTDGKYGFYVHNGKVGLAVFSEPEDCANFCKATKLSGMTVLGPLDFDDCRTIAKLSPVSPDGVMVSCLLLCDDLTNIVEHSLGNLRDKDLSDGTGNILGGL